MQQIFSDGKQIIITTDGNDNYVFKTNFIDRCEINFKTDFMEVQRFGDMVIEKVPTQRWAEVEIFLQCEIPEIVKGKIDFLKQMKPINIDKSLPREQLKRSLIF